MTPIRLTKAKFKLTDVAIQHSATRYELLGTGNPFFQDLQREIRQAKKYVMIKCFQWRNDEAGNFVAQELIDAAKRGVQVLIIKDRIGAFWEYAGGNGQSFFHDRPFKDSIFRQHGLYTIYPQARMLAKFIGVKVGKVRRNPLRALMTTIPNIHIIDQYKLYDHSKVFVVDGKVGYVGGIGIGNEFFKENSSRWVDHSLKITCEDAVQNLMLSLSSLPHQNAEDNDVNYITDNILRQSKTSWHQCALSFIRETKQELWLEMAYIGHPDYLKAMTQLAQRGVKIYLTTSQHADVHHYRNLHFIKKFHKVTKDLPNVKIRLHSRMIHSKVMIRDKELAFLGSHNLHMDESTLEETNIVSNNPVVVHSISKRVVKHYQEAAPYTEMGWHQFIAKSRVEYFGIKLQTWMCRLRREDIGYGRAHAQVAINDLIHTYHK